MALGKGRPSDNAAPGSLGAAITEAFHRTVDAARDITLELPGARTPREAADIVLRDDRKMYVGIILLALAAVTLLVGA